MTEDEKAAEAYRQRGLRIKQLKEEYAASRNYHQEGTVGHDYHLRNQGKPLTKGDVEPV
jgi:hypothetical protein